jgi:RNA polymerase sigma-70 factor (ECF subfamily)
VSPSNTNQTHHDYPWISRALKGDDQAFTEGVMLYKDKVFRLVMGILRNRELAEETTMDVFLKVHKYLPQFKGDSSFSSWLYRIAYNAALTALKKKKPTVSWDEEHNNLSTSGHGGEQQMMERDKQLAIQTVLEEMGPTQRSLLVLFYLEEYSIKEIVEMTRTSEGAVKTGLHKARKRFAEISEQRPDLKIAWT